MGGGGVWIGRPRPFIGRRGGRLRDSSSRLGLAPSASGVRARSHSASASRRMEIGERNRGTRDEGRALKR